VEDSKLKEIQIIELGTLDYEKALVRQRQMVDERIKERSPDCLLLVEHPPVVTIGRSGSLSDLHVSKRVLEEKGVALQQVERGGRATFHGPGQLVAYPIVKVADKDLHAFLKRLIDTAADVLRSYGLDPQYREGQPGVWVNGAKIASVGLAVRKWVTYHGIALNVTTDLGWFDLIIPCGQPGEKITSMENEMGRFVKMAEVKKRFVTKLLTRLASKSPGATESKLGRDPKWLVLPTTDRNAVGRMEKRLADLKLSTVCQRAHCPNLGECFARGTATFMIMGTRCTRRCRFCAVDKGIPGPVDENEPVRVAQAVQLLRLNHAVVTSVTRDDLPDGGAAQFAQTIRQIRKTCKDVYVEVLVPDFNGSVKALQSVCVSRPDVFNHNIETVARLYAVVRPVAKYRRSLAILSYAFSQGLWVKSGLMLGLGETQNEIKKTLLDLKHAGCAALTLGQYLAPSKGHIPVARYVSPKEFQMWAETARNMGFKAVAAGPLVRSSYRADAMLETERTSEHFIKKGSNLWKPKDLLSRSEPVPICMEKTSPRPRAGL
jgi:lipoic acid synthetase